MTTTALNPTDPSIAATLWLAYCSNRVRTVAECVRKTQETLAGVSVEDERNQLADWIGNLAITAYMNRGNDETLVAALFAMDNARLALGCAETALSIYMRGTERDMDVQPYITGYATRYGESERYLTLKLRWITLYTNYLHNVDEVERITTLLTGSKDVGEVA